MRTWRLTLGALLGFVLLASCAPLPPPPSQAAGQIQARAKLAEHQRDWGHAARLYTTLARITRGHREAGRALVEAALDRIRSGHPRAAHLLLTGPLAQTIGQKALLQAASTLGSSLIQGHHPRPFLVLVDALPAPAVLDSAPLLKLAGEAWYAEGRAAPALELLDRRARLLTRPAARKRNARLLWSGLIRIATTRTQPLARPSTAGRTESAWIALANLMRQAFENPGAFPSALHAFKRRFPDHRAQDVIIRSLVRELARLNHFPKSIAVLLPLTGRYAQAGRLIERGILASRYQESPSAAVPLIRFYNTGGHVAGALKAYHRALHNQAGWIIGPLLKPQVTALLQRHPTVGVLALNNVPAPKAPRPRRFYEFGLTPRDELRQITTRLIESGRLYGGALVPHGPWGRAILKDVQHDLKRGDGKLIAIEHYTPNRRSYSSRLEHFLKIRASIIRGQGLEGTLGMPLSFTPAPRSDLDFILLMANTLDAREIMPELHYFGVTSVPVYGLSRDNVPGVIHDDLDGLRVLVTPWSIGTHGPWKRIRTELASLWPGAGPHAGRLMALGFDAYRLIPWLRRPLPPGTRLFWGSTGFLSLGKHGRINRRLIWVRFESGRAVPIHALRTQN